RGLRPCYAAPAPRTSHNTGYTQYRSTVRLRTPTRYCVYPACRYTKSAPQILYNGTRASPVLCCARSADFA
ncbi:MAG: hypothetical protein LBJ41_12315, partial [Treponema sp.]|nr:hypothetical protein [Treponema sp.]